MTSRRLIVDQKLLSEVASTRPSPLNTIASTIIGNFVLITEMKVLREWHRIISQVPYPSTWQRNTRGIFYRCTLVFAYIA